MPELIVSPLVLGMIVSPLRLTFPPEVEMVCAEAPLKMVPRPLKVRFPPCVVRSPLTTMPPVPLLSESAVNVIPRAPLLTELPRINELASASDTFAPVTETVPVKSLAALARVTLLAPAAMFVVPPTDRTVPDACVTLPLAIMSRLPPEVEMVWPETPMKTVSTPLKERFPPCVVRSPLTNVPPVPLLSESAVNVSPRAPLLLAML